MDEFPHLPSVVRPVAGEPSAAPATANGAGIDSAVNDACDSSLDNISIFSGFSDDSEADVVASVGDTPANGGGSDVNSNLVSVGVSPPNPDDVNVDSTSPTVNANDKTCGMSNEAVTAASGGANVHSSCKGTAAIGDANVCEKSSIVNVEAAANSVSVNVEPTVNSDVVSNKPVATATAGQIHTVI